MPTPTLSGEDPTPRPARNPSGPIRRWIHATLGLALLGAAHLGCSTYHPVVPVEKDKNGKAKKDGVEYALPRTILQVVAKVARVEKAPSEEMVRIWALLTGSSQGANLADIPFLTNEFKAIGLTTNEVCLVASTNFSLEAADVSTRAEPDPSQVYTVVLPQGWGRKRDLKLNLGSDGIIGSASDTVTDKRSEIIVGNISALAKLATRATTMALATAADPGVAAANIANSTEPKLALRNHVLMVLGIREELAKLYKDAAKNPGQQLDVLKELVAQLKKEEEQALAFFTGGTKTTLVEIPIDVCIASNTVSEPRAQAPGIPLFDLDPGLGLHPGRSPDPAVRPFHIPAKVLNPTGPSGNPVPLTLSFDPARDQQLAGKVLPPHPTERSYRYRIPARVRVAVGNPANPLKIWTGPIAQAGEVLALPAHIRGGSSTLSPTFYPETGALKELGIGIDPGKVGLEDLAGTATTTLETIKASGDPLAEAKYQADLLEALKKAHDARQYLQTNGVAIPGR